ncbi:hypothetical protein ABTZ46_09510 [Nocardioides sp. NPDC126508]
MRAIQRAIVGVGLAVVATVAMALLIGGLRSIGPDQASQPAQQATGPQSVLDGPTGPPEPVEAAEDTSVGTLPPPPDAALATQLASRDLLAPADPPSNTQQPAEGSPLSARKTRKKPAEPSDRVPAMPRQDFTAAQDGWEWDWNGWSGWDDDCRRTDPDDRRDACDDRDRRD